MSNQPAARASHPADNHGGLRLLALAAVAAGVILLAAAAFVLSYSGIHAVALSAGVSPRFARLYPLIFDAMLVVACAAVLALRSAGLPSRSYAWLSLLALLVAAAAADALNATGTKLPHRPTAAVIAVLPWALVLIGFGLLLCMLRHARQRRITVATAEQTRAVEPAGHVQMRTGIDDLLGPRAFPAEVGAGQAAVKAAPAPAITAGGARPASGSVPPPDLPADLAIDLEPGLDDPASDEAAQPEPLAQVARIPRAREEALSDDKAAVGPLTAPPLSPAPTAESAPVSVSVPDARPAPDTRPAPDAAPAHDQESAAAAGPPPDAPAAHHVPPVAETGTAPEARPAPDDSPAHDPGSASDARPAPDDSPTHDPGSAPAARPGADAAPAHDQESAAEGGPEPDGEATLDDETKAAAEASRQAGSPRQPGEAPLLQFDRMRSSPIPPGS
jgi:Protein of unknown function (DUF2637)